MYDISALTFTGNVYSSWNQWRSNGGSSSVTTSSTSLTEASTIGSGMAHSGIRQVAQLW